MRKTNIYSRLQETLSTAPDWALWLLLLLTVTVFVMAARGPLSLFPHQSSATRSYQMQHDPYDLRAETGNGRRSHIGTGL